MSKHTVYTQGGYEGGQFNLCDLNVKYEKYFIYVMSDLLFTWGCKVEPDKDSET